MILRLLLMSLIIYVRLWKVCKMAKTLVGMNIIKSKKSGKKFMMLNLVDDTYLDSIDHSIPEAIFSSAEQTGWGQMVSTEFLDLENLGDVDINGDLVPGCVVRLFKEDVDGMDKITLIQVVDSKKK